MSDPPPALRNARYAITKQLGEGGQAATFDAVDKLEGRPVVVKRFRVRGASSWKEVELAEREANVLATLNHPNLPRYVEHFEEGGELYLVTQKIEGESLAARRRRGGAFTVADVERFLADSRVALAYLHGRAPPVVHRDIKPGNVIARPDGSFVIIDFGAVRDRLKPEGGSTVVGTFGYMAPEQFQGRAMPASDVYAVGVTALTMLTGTEPEDLPHRGLAIDVAGALRGLNLRPELVRALERMVAPDPDARASSVPELGAPRAGRSSRGREPDPGRSSDEPARRSEPSRAAQRGRGGDVARGFVDLQKEFREKKNELKRELRAERRAAHEGRRAARREERRARSFRRGFRFWDGRGLAPFARALFVFGLALAEVTVRLATGVVVPLWLTMLSLVFGSRLRDAARRVRLSGRRAAILVKYTRRVLQGRAPSHFAVGPGPGAAQEAEAVVGRPGARVEPMPAERLRVETPRTWTDEHEHESEAEAEADARTARRR